MRSAEFLSSETSFRLGTSGLVTGNRPRPGVWTLARKSERARKLRDLPAETLAISLDSKRLAYRATDGRLAIQNAQGREVITGPARWRMSIVPHLDWKQVVHVRADAADLGGFGRQVRGFREFDRFERATGPVQFAGRRSGGGLLRVAGSWDGSHLQDDETAVKRGVCRQKSDSGVHMGTG